MRRREAAGRASDARANGGQGLLLKARGAAFADLVGKVVQSAGDISASGKINGEGVACLAAMSGDANLASTEFTASINGATSVLTAVGVK